MSTFALLSTLPAPAALATVPTPIGNLKKGSQQGIARKGGCRALRIIQGIG